MSAQKAPPKGALRFIMWGAILAVLTLAMWPFANDIRRVAGRAQLHAPDIGLILAEPVTVQIHIASALAAFFIGLVILFRRKGTGMHKTLGWAWVAAMATTAVSSLFITGLNGDAYSFIHLITGWVIVALPLGVRAIRNRNVNAHKRFMTGLFVGGLIVAGAFTFVPGRLMWNVFFS